MIQLVDEPLDGVPLLVKIAVVACGSAAPAALLLPVGGLDLLLRDDCLDAAFPQIRAVSAGRVGFVRGASVGPWPGTADRQTDPDFLQHGDELRLPAACPAVSTSDNGRQLQSAAR